MQTAFLRDLGSVLLAAGVFCSGLSGCDSGAKFLVTVGPVEFGTSASEVELPAELRDSSGGAPVLRSVACGPSMPCPMLDASLGFALVCEESVCDPTAKQLDLPLGEALDLEQYGSSYGAAFDALESVTIDELRVSVQRNTLSFALPPIEISWGPENASGFDASRKLGTIPSLGAGATALGEVVLDDAGVLALSDFLLRSSRKFRLFGRTSVDLEPGQAFPEGALDLAASMDVTLETKGLEF